MKHQAMKFYAKNDANIVLHVMQGHFVTSHSHINYYVDMTDLKTKRDEAQAVARAFAQRIPRGTYIDTVVCMDGCEVIGAYLAEELEKNMIQSLNQDHTVYIVTPEFNSNNQMIFRDNLVPAIYDKHVLVLMATSTTGQTIERSMECIQYYGGIVESICSVFSAIPEVSHHKVESIFTLEDLPNYQVYNYYDCPYCKEKIKVDAFVNGYGYSKVSM